MDGELLVAHEPATLDPARTLASLYLDPLAALVRAAHGSVHPHHRAPLQLLVDLKADGVAAYRELDRQLRRHSYVTRYRHGRVRTGAVTVVISGDRAARAPMEAQEDRLAFYDGRLDDLGTPAPATFAPLVSANWTQSFDWLGAGPFPRAERDRLRTLVATAHREGRRIRFWATPDLPGPNARPSGPSCSPPGWTTSTPTTWPDSKRSSAAVEEPPGRCNARPPGSTRSADTPVRRTAFPLRHTGRRMPQIRRGGGGWPWPFRSHWCCF